MNVRIIDPGKSFSTRPRQWGQSAGDDELGELDELPVMVPDDRLELLVDLRSLQCQVLTEGLARHLVPESLLIYWSERVEQVRSSIGSLEKIARELGLEIPPARRVDLEGGFAEMPVTPRGHLLSTAPGLIGAALFFNSLGLVVVSAFLREEEKTVLKNALLPILAEDSRFEGRLKGYLEGQGVAADAEPDEWLSLAAGA